MSGTKPFEMQIPDEGSGNPEGGYYRSREIESTEAGLRYERISRLWQETVQRKPR